MRSMVRWPLLVLVAMGYIACTHIKPLQSEQPVPISGATESQEQASAQTPAETVQTSPATVVLTERLQKYCQKIDQQFQRYQWPVNNCARTSWIHVRDSINGDPLIWTVFGDEEQIKLSTTEVTMLMCGVHGDEITPVQFCFDAIEHFRQRPELFVGRVLVVAPIVNPDSFFRAQPSRTNAHGVDINRNFPTKDWHAKAHRYWRDRYSSDKRRHPGNKPLSEPEVVFQVNLIKRYMPDKIISVHAPLTLLDLDGPEISAPADSSSIGHVANELLIQMSQKAKGYKVKNYPFFPGSLGNWAGNERNIPTYTLELPDSDPANTEKFWNMFKDAIQSAVLHPFKLVQKSLDQQTPSPEPVEVAD